MLLPRTSSNNISLCLITAGLSRVPAARWVKRLWRGLEFNLCEFEEEEEGRRPWNVDIGPFKYAYRAVITLQESWRTGAVTSRH